MIVRESHGTRVVMGMTVYRLALSVMLLALFTFSSVVVFEIFEPPVVKQERELFISAFTSDRYYKYDDQPSDRSIFTYSTSIPYSLPSGVVGVSVQRTPQKNGSYAGGSITAGSIPLHPLSSSASKKSLAHPSVAPSTIELVSAPMQPSRLRRMQQFVERSPVNLDTRRLMQNVNKISPPIRGMQAAMRRPNIKPKPSGQLGRRYVATRNNTLYFARKRQTLYRPPSRPHRLGLNCTDHSCVSYLLDTDYRAFKVCQSWAEKKTRMNYTKINATCKFMKGVSRDPVGLVSVPGSGNTWVRGLLEKATGICTGSIYCDHPLRNGGMIGEYVKTGRVLVVKTHTSDYQWKDVKAEKRNNDDGLYGSAILLIRNPFKSFIAEWNRLNALSAYTGRPIEPRNRTTHIRRGIAVPSSYSYRNRKRPPVPPSRVNVTKVGPDNIHQHSQKHFISKRINGTIRYSMQTVGRDREDIETVRKDGVDERVSLVGRKLLAFPTKRLKEDVSHTIEVDQKKFGKGIITGVVV